MMELTPAVNAAGCLDMVVMGFLGPCNGSTLSLLLHLLLLLLLPML
jgi:hypothetical protein